MKIDAGDENVHGAITAGLRLRDVDVLTVQEDKRAGFADTLVLNRATELGRVVFSQDKDFLTALNHQNVIVGKTNTTRELSKLDLFKNTCTIRIEEQCTGDIVIDEAIACLSRS
ncbi:MAG: hypothetical protein F6K47_06715 [Symploca sp. SIO2E6]|nr:hypothetical protein [Symploca sp. SIO2E6]